MTGEKAIESTPDSAPKDLNFGKKSGVIGSEKIEHQPPSKEPMIHSLKHSVFSAYPFFKGLFVGAASLILAEQFSLFCGMGTYGLPWAVLFFVLALFFAWKRKHPEVRAESQDGKKIPAGGPWQPARTSCHKKNSEKQN